MNSAIILAGGKGQRIGIKKQFFKIAGLPLISHILKTFDESKHINFIYLVVPKNDIYTCQKKIINPLKLNHKVYILSGGKTRQLSVLRALNKINNKTKTVLIHDGSRPFVTKKLISRTITGVKKTGACIPVVPINDSIVEIKNQKAFTSKFFKKKLWLIQTPQVFNFELINYAHIFAQKKKFKGTDDSSIAEKAGASINIIQGNSFNIKVTTKDDIIIAKALASLFLIKNIRKNKINSKKI